MAAEPIPLELLAPARDADTAITAIMHGADAVYIGGPAFGARSAASNQFDEIARVVQAARPFGVKVYVTINTILYDNELDEVRRLVTKLYDIGVDAIIVQDMALLEMDIPPIELHASTQCDARTPEKTAFLARAGFTQVVLPREFSLRQIRAAAQAAPGAAMEVFVHGALCVSYSGDCQAGFVTTGRSANRGCCPQICRLEFRLTDSHGNTITPPDGGRATRHWLSLADMNRLVSLAQLADAGARSFKIEGRLKNPSYVKQVTAAYSAALDNMIASSGGCYRRASFGRCTTTFTPDLNTCFNRGFTQYFLHPADTHVSSTLTPKWTGPRIGSYLRKNGTAIEIDSNAELHAGDGLGWFDNDRRFHGFRVNRVEGTLVHPAPKSDTPSQPGTALYRNHDLAGETRLARNDTSRRTITISATLSTDSKGRAQLTVNDERGISVTVTSESTFTDAANKDQSTYRHNQLSRLGNTCYTLGDYHDEIPAIFIPASELAALRRAATDALDKAWADRPRCQSSPRPTLPSDALKGITLTYHDNVANHLSARFYESHGAIIDGHAIETEPHTGELQVMTTRYCLRRDQEACLRRPEQANRLPGGDLYLEAPVGRLRLHCDCDQCQMQIFIDRP